MRTTFLSLLTILCLMLAVAPAMAETFYDNGPYNGTTDAWTINFGFTVSDSAVPGCGVGQPNCELEDFHGVFWLFPGDSFGSVDMDFGSTSFGSDLGHVGGATPSGSQDLGINQYGYDLQEVWWNFYSISVPNGSGLYVTLGNAVETVFGDPIYWDENSGPSSAYENTLGSIPSEAFTLTGSGCCGPPVPEPSSILLFGSGILGLGGVLRRWLF